MFSLFNMFSGGGGTSGFMGNNNWMTAFSLIGKGLSALGQYQETKRQAELYEYNAAIYRQQADLIRQKTELQLEQQRRKARKFKGEQIATIGASGVRYSGSPLEVYTDSVEQLILEENIISFNGQMEEAYALNQAEFSMMKAQNSRYSGFIQAGTNMLSALPDFGKFSFGKTTTTPESTMSVGSGSFIPSGTMMA